MSIILGISAFYHDSAAAIIKDGDIIACAQEERFTRKKHDASFPKNAILFCLNAAKLDLESIDYIAFYDKPFLKFERLLETYLAFAPRGFLSFQKSIPVWLKEKLFLKRLLNNELNEIEKPRHKKQNYNKKIIFTEHHQSHAASAFYASPFTEALVLTMDGVGEWATTSVALGKHNDLKIIKEIHFPHSLGLLYSAFTYYLGFKVNSGEYKVMGLAPYGEPNYLDIIMNHLIDIKEDGSYRLNLHYFDYCTGLTMTNAKFHALFGGPPRGKETPLTQKHMDLAASIQKLTEIIVLKLTNALQKETGLENLCLAGGVALNCVANGKIVKEGRFKNIWVQPASGDAGGALGAALAADHYFLGNERQVKNHDAMKGSYLGPVYEDSDIEATLLNIGAKFTKLNQDQLIKKVAKDISEGKAIGWFQGRMEFGPRALGNRSILGDPRDPNMQKMLNLKVKYRESFRPFAPAVLREDVREWFEIDEDSPYMLLVANVSSEKRHALPKNFESLFGLDKLNLNRSQIPAVTHVDYSARIQTVDQETNPIFHQLLTEFKAITGCPVLINTSFNVRGEPIVCTPEDAYRCFMGTELDVLALGNYYLMKEAQDKSRVLNYKEAFELD